MDKILANKISEDIVSELKQIAKKYNVTFSRGNGKYDSTHFSLKIEFTDSVYNLPKQNADMETIQHGFAKPGTKVKLINSGKEVTITKVRRTNYEIDLDGKTYIINFRGCTTLN